MTGQLNLFGSRRQRGRRSPPPKEFQTHCAIADLLRRWAMPGWIWTHFPSGEARPSAIDKKGRRYSPAGQRLARMGLNSGFPDLFFFHQSGKCFFLELKRKGSGRLSEQQDEIATFLMAAGHGYLCTDSFDDAVATLKDVGILRSDIQVQ